LKGTHLGTIPATLGLIWFGGFRGEDWTDGRQVMAKAHIAFGIPGFSVKYFFQPIFTDYAN
jgi:hypothetical protein